MAVEPKLENDVLIDCIVYDEEGIDDQIITSKRTVIPIEDAFEYQNKKKKDTTITMCQIKPLDPDDIKFGEIFLSNKGANLYFMCYFCSKSYYKIQDYVQHCVEDHNIDSWNVFNFLQNKKTAKGTPKTNYKNTRNKYRIEGKHVKNFSDHDHTYDRITTNKIVNERNMNFFRNKDTKQKETLDNLHLELDLESALNDNIPSVHFKEECVDYEEKSSEGYLEEQLNQENDDVRSMQSIEDSDESTDFEDPADLRKIKRCIHCLTEVINFKLHMKIKHFDLLHKCEIPYCYELFLTEKRLKEHIAIVHRDPQKPFACKNCDYKTNKKCSLDIHFERIHLKIRNKRCSYCEKTFYDSGELKKHERVHTGERPAMCYICGKGLRTTQDLNKHILRDHGEPTFDCKVCGKKFHLKETLLKHNFVHSNERPHICHVCGKGFKHIKHLRGHMDLHSIIKKYECKVCGKRFAQKNNYTGHQKIHNKTGEVKNI